MANKSVIRVVEAGAKFEVKSASGSTYQISYAGSGDGDPEYIGLWQCNCPAGQHGQECKHMRAFLNSSIMDFGTVEDDGSVSQEIEF